MHEQAVQGHKKEYTFRMEPQDLEGDEGCLACFPMGCEAESKALCPLKQEVSQTIHTSLPGKDI